MVERKFVWATLSIASLASFIIVIDSFFLNVAITTLVRDLHTTVDVIQGIIAAYALTMACLMLLGAKLQNVLGRKRAFLYGALIYGVGTTIAALSLNAAMLLFGWSLLEGVGAALGCRRRRRSFQLRTRAMIARSRSVSGWLSVRSRQPWALS